MPATSSPCTRITTRSPSTIPWKGLTVTWIACAFPRTHSMLTWPTSTSTSSAVPISHLPMRPIPITRLRLTLIISRRMESMSTLLRSTARAWRRCTRTQWISSTARPRNRSRPKLTSTSLPKASNALTRFGRNSRSKAASVPAFTSSAVSSSQDLPPLPFFSSSENASGKSCMIKN